MIVLQDVDVIVKCAECGFFETLPELIGCDDGEIKILPSSRFVIEKKIRPEQGVLETALNFCREHDSLPELASQMNFNLIKEERIEEGEALLFAVAIEVEANIFSGDKRAIMVLEKKRPKIRGIVDQLNGRVICFEEFLLRYYETYGFDDLRNACIKSKDSMLMQCFSNGNLTEEENAMYGIRSNYRHLAGKSGDLLVHREIEELE